MHEQCADQVFAFAHAHAAIVEERAVAFAGGEQFVAQRIVDHAVHRIAVIEKSDRNAEMRKAAQIIVRAVERIDDPHLVGFAGRAGFFAEEGVIRIRLAQLLDDLGLGHLVDFAHVVVPRLFLDGKSFDAIDVAKDDVSGGACGAHGDGDGGSRHGGIRSAG